MSYLPLTNNPEEEFSSTINEILYNFRQLWNTEYEFWVLDILDADLNEIVLGVKIVAKTYLLQQFPEIPFDLYSSREADPSRNNLNEFNLEVSVKDV